TVPAHPRRPDAAACVAAVHVPPGRGAGDRGRARRIRSPTSRVAWQAGGRPVGARRRRRDTGPIGTGRPRGTPATGHGGAGPRRGSLVRYARDTRCGGRAGTAGRTA